ncbi:hypothetical protein JGS22_003870 [Streptomyces sp. P38-E01]|uniref:Uncharacterized protein n=1 Tax=Streptomyces tardus TaxID=2780544 RepID=A0A949N4C0_9ACTN|nr:hypothetical protein [Streptomyces tardus]MBU7596797.1 hypothetical protein [Streptomyces tardus]
MSNYDQNPYGPPPQSGPPGSSPYGPPHQDPYGAPPAYGQPQAQSPYGQQPYGQQPYGPPGHAYPPHGPMAPASMPGMVITARVLLFVAGGLWAILALFMIGFALLAGDIDAEEEFKDLADVAAGIGLLFFVIFGGLAALHIVPASLFGKGGTATRVVAIVAASINGLVALLSLAGSLTDGGSTANSPGSPLISLVWLATAVVTLVFCSGPQASQWFNRPKL